ncbi:NAD-dependent epimerase/dehydratase family protein [Candidatus Lucifugimonas marina]|uniref:NAD-dependent epimerase/dehydratase family protein n=1 Tax=Candidatus Lucifugimonas marina TaxID=3038979 RepID=A0AAJ5ZF42_9CHLR|nr:NAD-dependent epimerase/dehydratase family protein [SAR202 cluster bacterium JH702]MDG0868281.1 NAD-dependent epimerase/dehydratase family protein [SAR202 cluster bacterium JH639]WFG38876.1 NAD-dependent epimerase/dehydratase family protein [SAR202 cluster bacterium JH1073]
MALVTGAAGFIGSHLVDRLIADGIEVTGIDDLSSGRLANLPEGFDLREMDIRSPKVRDVVVEIRPDIVFHLAAQISVSISAREPQLDADVNVGGALNLLEGVRALGDKTVKLVYITSGGTAYGDPEIVPADESTLIRPLSPYGVSKFAVELYLPVYEQLCGLEYSIIRLANIYGPRQDPHGEAGVVAIFAKAMLAGKPLTIFGDGNDERDYVFVGDVVEAIARAGNGSLQGPFNIGTGIGTSTNQIFELVAKYCGHAETAVHSAPRPGDINRISLDSSRAKRELGWSAQIDIEDGFKTTVDWFKQQAD